MVTCRDTFSETVLPVVPMTEYGGGSTNHTQVGALMVFSEGAFTLLAVSCESTYGKSPVIRAGILLIGSCIWMRSLNRRKSRRPKDHRSHLYSALCDTALFLRLLAESHFCSEEPLI